ncbi:MAG: RIP metalloprotease RseP [Prevotellaceae bacterium]|jgi:regulator of sigma E protease|nr:RIP metalloprotease RseP [Prevotellaceae bacterium]
MGIVIQIAQLLLSLSLLVLVHELGHFLVSRAFKVRVKKFYLFFNPWASLLRAKRIDGKWQLSWFSKKSPEKWEGYPENTEWGLGWLPLGGYCSIAGMIDESMDTEAMKQPVQPWEFRSRPAWQRFFIITGGVIVNFVTALVIYAMALFTWGEEYLPIKNVTWGYAYCQAAKNAGFVDGDKILQVDNVEPVTNGEAVGAILLADGKTVVVDREGEKVNIALPHDFSQRILASKTEMFSAERIPFVIESVADGSPAQEAKLQPGDSIVGVNGQATAFMHQLTDSLRHHAGKPVMLTLYRKGELLAESLVVNSEGKLGVYTKSPLHYFTTVKRAYGFLEAIPAGISKGFNQLVSYVKQFKVVFTKEGVTNLGGFGTIGGLFSTAWNWYHFWSMTAFLSIILAFMNILPIPALDGGHMIFILYEMIARCKPNEKFMEYAQMAGMFLLLALLIFANGNDLVRWLSKFF